MHCANLMKTRTLRVMPLMSFLSSISITVKFFSGVITGRTYKSDMLVLFYPMLIVCRDSLVKDRHGIEVEVNPIKIAGESTEYTFNSNSGTYTAKVDRLVQPAVLLTVLLQLSIHQFLLKNCSIAYSFKVTNRSKETVNLMEANLIYPTEYFHIVDPQCYLEQGHIVPLAPGKENED